MLVFRYTIVIHILIALLATFILYVCIRPLTSVSESLLLTDVIASGISLAALTIVLKHVSKYSHFSELPIFQKVINYCALATLFTICWLGTSFFVLYILYTEEEWNSLFPLIPMRIVLSLLTYGFIVVLYNQIYDRNETILDELLDKEYEESEVLELADAEQNEDSKEAEEIIDRIVVKNGQKIDVVMVADVMYLQAEGDYVMIHSTKGKFLKEQTMKLFESQLPADKFVRVHRSSIVNIDYIAQIELYDKQSQLLKLKNGAQVKTSMSGYKALKKTLGL